MGPGVRANDSKVSLAWDFSILGDSRHLGAFWAAVVDVIAKPQFEIPLYSFEVEGQERTGRSVKALSTIDLFHEAFALWGFLLLLISSFLSPALWHCWRFRNLSGLLRGLG